MAAELKTFRELRNAKGFTQQALADISDVDIGAIRNIEHGDTANPRSETIAALSKPLAVSDNELRLSIRHTVALGRVTDDYNQKYKICESLFQILGSQNAKCDIKIFHELYMFLPPTRLTDAAKMARLSATHLSMELIRSNMSNVLDTLADLVETMTGEPCSTCLQVISVKDGASAETGRVRTVVRDRKSEGKRGLNDSRPIRGNTINEWLFLEGQTPIIVPDMPTAIKNGSIKVTTTGAGVYYNNVILLAIPGVRDNLDEEDYKPTSSLCIDSMKQFRDDRLDVCLHFAAELAWRLGTMQYMLDNISAEYERTKGQLDRGGTRPWKKREI